MNRFKPTNYPGVEAQQRAHLLAERARVEESAAEVTATKNMHLDNLSQYTHRLRTIYAAARQDYDFQSDANIQYYQKAINLCDQRLDFLRLKYKNISELLDQ